jgi:hypothetical protein
VEEKGNILNLKSGGEGHYIDPEHLRRRATY